MPDDESGGFIMFYPAACVPVNIMSNLKTEPRPFVSVITPAGAERVGVSTATVVSP